MPKNKLTPQKKKALSYEHDHRSRGGESKIAWRRAKPLKKRKAVRTFRRKQRAATIKGVETESATEVAAQRNLGAFKQRKVVDWGVMSLKEYVGNRKVGARHIRYHIRDLQVKG